MSTLNIWATPPRPLTPAPIRNTQLSLAAFGHRGALQKRLVCPVYTLCLINRLTQITYVTVLVWIRTLQSLLELGDEFLSLCLVDILHTRL